MPSAMIAESIFSANETSPAVSACCETSDSMPSMSVRSSLMKSGASRRMCRRLANPAPASSIASRTPARLSRASASSSASYSRIGACSVSSTTMRRGVDLREQVAEALADERRRREVHAEVELLGELPQRGQRAAHGLQLQLAAQPDRDASVNHSIGPRTGVPEKRASASTPTTPPPREVADRLEHHGQPSVSSSAPRTRSSGRARLRRRLPVAAELVHELRITSPVTSTDRLPCPSAARSIDSTTPAIEPPFTR